MICPKCQSVLNDEAQVCGYCGTRLNAGPAQAQPKAQAQAPTRPVTPSVQAPVYTAPVAPPVRQPGYAPAAPQPYAPGMPAPTNGAAVGAMVCGVLCFFLPGLIGLIVKIVGIVLGVSGQKRAQEIGSGAETAKAGMILSIISLVVTLLALITLGILFVSGAFRFSRLGNEIEYFIESLI